MITSVTTTTFTTAALSHSIAAISVLILVVMLMQKEIATVTYDRRFRRLNRALNVALVPLLVVFAAIVISALVDVMR
jgi:hypothetical protein